MSTKEAYDKIMESEVFRLNGPKIQLSEALIDLGSAIQEEDETDWNMGEFTEAPLDSLVVGAYWSLTEWHAGQSSDSYAAMCALGQIFYPGMSSIEEDAPEYIAYEMVNAHFEKGGK